MLTFKRKLMGAGIGLLLLASASANAAVSLVKVINFSCSYCKSSEAMDPPIRAAIEMGGGKMVFATMPSDESSDGSREKFYYAARSRLPAQEPRIRASLYKGAQELGYPLATANQTAEWLSTDLVDLNYDWLSLIPDTSGASADQAYTRAIRLAVQAGVQVLPTYVLVKDGLVIRTLDVDSAGGTYSGLRQSVLDAISKANTTSNP